MALRVWQLSVHMRTQFMALLHVIKLWIWESAACVCARECVSLRRGLARIRDDWICQPARTLITSSGSLPSNRSHLWRTLAIQEAQIQTESLRKVQVNEQYRYNPEIPFFSLPSNIKFPLWLSKTAGTIDAFEGIHVWLPGNFKEKWLNETDLILINKSKSPLSEA